MDLTPIAPEEYCRQLEAYLCRKNDGHLVRIVGPAFEEVCSWAARGIPFKVACRGVDRYFERYYAKGRRRRPVRIEFCKADVEDVFDEWKRATGVGMFAGAPAGEGGSNEEGDDAGSRRHPSLPAHLDRVIARLTALRSGPERPLDDVLDGVVRELDAARAQAKSIRGEAREQLLARLRAIEASLVAQVRERCDSQELAAAGAEADAELAPFRDRMPKDAYEQSRAACVDRILRDRFRLPVIAFE